MKKIPVTLHYYLSVKKVKVHFHIKADQLTLKILHIDFDETRGLRKLWH